MEVLDKKFLIYTPTPDQLLNAQLVYIDALRFSELNGAISDEEIVQYMISHGMWSANEEGELKTINDRIDVIKVDMYQNFESYKSNRIKSLRNTLDKIKKRAAELTSKRHSYDYYTSGGLALMARLEYLLSKTTYDEEGNHVNTDLLYDGFTRKLVERYLTVKPTDSDVRQISKLDRWHSIWTAAKHGTSLFPVPAVEMSDEQRMLIGWSRLYDSVGECASPPAKEVIEDDDLLDGWLILEKRKRDAEHNSQTASKNSNGAHEVFVPVDSVEDAKRVEAMNDAEARMIKRQRMSAIAQKGALPEENLPDAKERMVMQATQQLRDRFKK